MDKKSRNIFLYILLAFTLTYIISMAFKNTSLSFNIKDNKVTYSIIPDGSKVNLDLSKCSEGSLDYDEITDTISFKSSNPSFCNIYLDESSNLIYYSSLKQAINDTIIKTYHGETSYFDEASVSINPSNNTIKLLKDIFIDEEIKIQKDIFINLNGHTLNFSPKAQNNFITIEKGYSLTIYGRKKGSMVYYSSDDNVPLFTLSDDSELNISVDKFSVAYSGKSVFSILKDEREKTAKINISHTNFIVDGANISFLYSAKPLNIDITNSSIYVNALGNTTLANLISKNSSVNISNTSIIYNEKDESSSSGKILNLPNATLSLDKSNIIIESDSIANNESKIVSHQLNINECNMTSKLSSDGAIIEVNESGIVKDFSLAASSDKSYIGILYLGNSELKIVDSNFNLKKENTPILYYKGNVLLENTNIEAMQAS